MKFLFYFENLGRKSIILYLILRFIFIKLFRGYFFEKEAHGFKKLKKKTNLNIVDIGANDGLSVSFFLSIFRDSNLFVFEPLKLNKNYLKKNNKNKIKYYNIALGEKNTVEKINIPYIVFFSYKIYLYAYSAISKKKQHMYEINKSLKTFFYYKKIKKKQLKIKIKTFDSFNIKPDIIKLDVEAYEDKVINGAKKTINKYKPLLYIERPTKQLISYLKKRKYEMYIFDVRKDLFKKAYYQSKEYRNYYFIYKKKNI